MLAQKKVPALKDLAYGSSAIQKLINNRGSFDPNTEVLSVAGKLFNIGTNGDGFVGINSALGLSKYTRNFTPLAVNGDTHSQLHEDQMSLVLSEFFFGAD